MNTRTKVDGGWIPIPPGTGLEWEDHDWVEFEVVDEDTVILHRTRAQRAEGVEKGRKKR